VTRRRALGLIALAAVASAVLFPDGALAHGIVGREDLPIPRWLFGWAATAVLVVSFVALAVLWPSPRLERARERDVVRFPLVLEILCGLAGVALFGFLVYAGIDGVQSQSANILPTFIYVIFWVGVPVASVLFGDVFRAFNPWRAIGRGFGWAAKRVAGDALPAALPYPERLGRWPAALGIFAFAWVELALNPVHSTDPSVLAWLAVAYAAVQLVGMALYGVDAWSDRGDGFGVFFGLFARLSPLHWHDRTLSVRPPLSGVTHTSPVPGTVALLAVAIGTTSFDGMSEQQWWSDLVLDIQDVLREVGLNATQGNEVAQTLGMIVTVLLLGGLFWLGVLGMRTVDRTQPAVSLARGFAASLVPIAFAYLLAHYFSLLAYQGQAVGFLASDPLGRGWDVFGTASDTIDYGVVDANAIWYVQVGALVLGHVAGLMLAHDKALSVYGDARAATRSQYWMLAVMVAFTSLGLWLLSSANG
jgi:hypothetical protein